VTGTAMSDYNTYISQLMGAAGLGTTANQGLQTGNQTTANNISQLQQNIGNAQAAGYSGVGSSVGGLFSPNGAGTSLIGAAGRYLNGGAGNGGGNGMPSGTNPNTGQPYQPGDINPTTGQPYDYQGTMGSGTPDPTINPNTGTPWSDPGSSMNQVPAFDPNTMLTDPGYSDFTMPDMSNVGGDLGNIDMSGWF
jgi:hypothetical protein